MPGRVSVVVATRNRRGQLLATLDRLSALPEQPPIVVVDNASDDGTPDAVRDLFPGMDVVCMGHNAGACARTAGVQRVGTPYVAFADDDSWWAPGALSRAADVLDAVPVLGLVAARVLVGPDESPDPVTEAQAAGPLPPVPGVPGIPIMGFLACGAIVRRTAYLEVGGFDELLHFVGEEEQLALDLADAGWALAYLDDVVAHHHPADRSPADGRTRRARAARNRLLVTWMRRPPGVAARRTAQAMAAAVADPAVRAGISEATRRLPAALRRRRVVAPAVDRRMRVLERSSPTP
jgi:GT2 family glycosyltransferase